MQRPSPLTFATLVPVPENRSAVSAIQQLVESVHGSRKLRQSPGSPLFLHGPSGAGKTHLVSALVEQWVRRDPGAAVTLLTAAEWNLLADRNCNADHDAFAELRNSDLFILEDLQHLSQAGAAALTAEFDDLQARGVPVVFTAGIGPRLLCVSERLRSRLAAGLVIRVEPLQAASRLAVLQNKAQRRQLAVNPAVLAWVADHVRGGRELEGALIRLETLARNSRLPLDVPAVAAHFEQAFKPTIDRIAQNVGRHFRVDLRQLRSERRRRHILLPRQIGMYLARQLTGLSLGQIGQYFGGRDHTTVLHACRKVEQEIARDAAFSGTVRQLYLDLA